jgi:hypothetical protein
MKNSIEVIWKEGFLNERSLVVPKIIDLYNQRSIDLVAKMKRMYRMNLIGLVMLSIVFPIIYSFLDVIWHGVAVSIVLLFAAWYSKRQKRSFKTLDHGATSFDYLKSFDRFLKDALLSGEKGLRFTYPLYFLIGVSAMWSILDKSGLGSIMHQQFPDLIFIGSVPLFALIIVGVATLLLLYFSGRIYRWDVGLVYGRELRKLEETIAEMAKLKDD